MVSDSGHSLESQSWVRFFHLSPLIKLMYCAYARVALCTSLKVSMTSYTMDWRQCCGPRLHKLLSHLWLEIQLQHTTTKDHTIIIHNAAVNIFLITWKYMSDHYCMERIHWLQVLTWLSKALQEKRKTLFYSFRMLKIQ